MKIGIVGIGFVGNALLNGINNNVEVMKIDPKLGTSIKNLSSFDPEITFICVPTPMNNDGSQDISVVYDVIDQLNLYKINSIIVLKSTVLPSHINSIEDKCTKFIYNPEFLTENNADEDFINSPLIIFGGQNKYAKTLSSFYKKYTKCIQNNHLFMDSISASLIKYSINSFLSTKVIFFNQLHEIFNASNTFEQWKVFTEAISRDPRIGSSHMDVPGHDGRFGFGGACFPKDTNAFYNYSKDIKKPFSLLNEVIKINNSLRSLYNDETEREQDQNIKFE